VFPPDTISKRRVCSAPSEFRNRQEFIPAGAYECRI
jgi:hypothetical protein